MQGVGVQCFAEVLCAMRVRARERKKSTAIAPRITANAIGVASTS